MKCPFRLPVETHTSPTDPDLRYISPIDKSRAVVVCGNIHKEYADYIVQAINSYEKYKELIKKQNPHQHDHSYFHDDCSLCQIEKKRFEKFEQALKEAGEPQ